jgi:beta-glucanase (GH16 family)
MTMSRSLFPFCLAALSLAVSGCDGAVASQDNPHIVEQGTIGVAIGPPAEANGWSMIWSDEFDGDQIDRSKWGFDIDCWGGGNAERQCYTDRIENAAIEDGNLVITALREQATGPALPPYLRAAADDPEATATKPFTSARLTTKGKMSWRYGRIDVRAKLPLGQGIWPAIWMLPEDNSYGPWATSGEIDILEAVNLGVPCEKCPGGTENRILGTLHFGGAWPANRFSSTEVALPGSLDDFHIFSIIWREGDFRWLVDGKVFASKKADDWTTTSSDDANAPFDKPFHLLINLAVGGGLPEGRGLGGVSDEGFPKRFEIDFVRVWKCQSERASAHHCGGIWND